MAQFPALVIERGININICKEVKITLPNWLVYLGLFVLAIIATIVTYVTGKRWERRRRKKIIDNIRYTSFTENMYEHGRYYLILSTQWEKEAFLQWFQ